MIKILKQGIEPKNTRIIYTTICDYCNCMFEFETEDIKAQEKSFYGRVFIDCPNCHKELQKTYIALDHRIVEVLDND